MKNIVRTEADKITNFLNKQGYSSEDLGEYYKLLQAGQVKTYSMEWPAYPSVDAVKFKAQDDVQAVRWALRNFDAGFDIVEVITTTRVVPIEEGLNSLEFNSTSR